MSAESREELLGAASPRVRALHAFGRGYVLGKYRVRSAGPRTRLATFLLDAPTLVVHLVARREATPIRERRRGYRLGLRQARSAPAPLLLATVGVGEALRRQARHLGRRLTGSLPRHFYDTHTGAPS